MPSLSLSLSAHVLVLVVHSSAKVKNSTSFKSDIFAETCSFPVLEDQILDTGDALMDDEEGYVYLPKLARLWLDNRAFPGLHWPPTC